jgi:hypothetical protein
MSVRGFESLSLRHVEAWQSGDCSGLEHRRPLGVRRFESYSLRPRKVGRNRYCTVLLRRRPLGVCEFEPRTFRPAAGDPCDYPLMRPLVLVLAALAARAVAAYLADGRRQDFEVTWRDLSVSAYTAPLQVAQNRP